MTKIFAQWVLPGKAIRVIADERDDGNAPLLTRNETATVLKNIEAGHIIECESRCACFLAAE